LATRIFANGALIVYSNARVAANPAQALAQQDASGRRAERAGFALVAS
jgi:hypothetical protein